MKFDAKQVDFIVGLVNRYSAFLIPKDFLIENNGIETYLSEKDEAFRDVFPYMDKYVDKDGGSVNAIYNPFGEYTKAGAINNYMNIRSKNYFDMAVMDSFTNEVCYLILDETSGELELSLIREKDFNVKYTKAVAKIV